MADERLVNPELIIKQLREEQETSKQFIYEYKRKIHSLEILEKEYQEEIERLNQDQKKVVNKLEIKIEQFEEEKCHLRNNNNEEVQTLQKELAELHLENKRLKNEIDLKKNDFFVISEEAPKEDIDDLNANIRDLESLIENLNVQLNLSQKQCSDLKEIERVLKHENESLQENVNLKREELHQANELIQDLQDNIMCLKAELDSVKNTPLDEQSRGNSLFAEVNDSRVQLMKKLKLVMTKYNEMAKDRDNLLREIECLRSEKARMIQIFETDIQQYRSGNRIEEDAQKSTIDGLMNLIDNYKKEVENLKRGDDAPVPKDLKYYETCLKSKEKEIKSLRDTLESHSTSHILKARNIAQLGREMVNWKWKASEFENQVQILNNKLKEFEQGYNKELDKSSIIIAKDLNQKFGEHKENQNVGRNNSKDNNEKVQKNHVLKEKNFIENICEQKRVSLKTNEPEEQKQECAEDKGGVIDLTSDDEETESKKTVHFSEDTKTASENVTLRKAAVVVRTHLPVTSFRKPK